MADCSQSSSLGLINVDGLTNDGFGVDSSDIQCSLFQFQDEPVAINHGDSNRACLRTIPAEIQTDARNHDSSTSTPTASNCDGGVGGVPSYLLRPDTSTLSPPDPAHSLFPSTDNSVMSTANQDGVPGAGVVAEKYDTNIVRAPFCLANRMKISPMFDAQQSMIDISGFRISARSTSIGPTSVVPTNGLAPPMGPSVAVEPDLLTEAEPKVSNSESALLNLSQMPSNMGCSFPMMADSGDDFHKEFENGDFVKSNDALRAELAADEQLLCSVNDDVIDDVSTRHATKSNVTRCPIERSRNEFSDSDLSMVKLKYFEGFSEPLGALGDTRGIERPPFGLSHQTILPDTSNECCTLHDSSSSGSIVTSGNTTISPESYDSADNNNNHNNTTNAFLPAMIGQNGSNTAAAETTEKLSQCRDNVSAIQSRHVPSGSGDDCSAQPLSVSPSAVSSISRPCVKSRPVPSFDYMSSSLAVSTSVSSTSNSVHSSSSSSHYHSLSSSASTHTAAASLVKTSDDVTTQSGDVTTRFGDVTTAVHDAAAVVQCVRRQLDQQLMSLADLNSPVNVTQLLSELQVGEPLVNDIGESACHDLPCTAGNTTAVNHTRSCDLSNIASAGSGTANDTYSIVGVGEISNNVTSEQQQGQVQGVTTAATAADRAAPHRGADSDSRGLNTIPSSNRHHACHIPREPHALGVVGRPRTAKLATTALKTDPRSLAAESGSVNSGGAMEKRRFPRLGSLSRTQTTKSAPISSSSIGTTSASATATNCLVVASNATTITDISAPAAPYSITTSSAPVIMAKSTDIYIGAGVKFQRSRIPTPLWRQGSSSGSGSDNSANEDASHRPPPPSVSATGDFAVRGGVHENRRLTRRLAQTRAILNAAAAVESGSSDSTLTSSYSDESMRRRQPAFVPGPAQESAPVASNTNLSPTPQSDTLSSSSDYVVCTPHHHRMIEEESISGVVLSAVRDADRRAQVVSADADVSADKPSAVASHAANLFSVPDIVSMDAIYCVGTVVHLSIPVSGLTDSPLDVSAIIKGASIDTASSDVGNVVHPVVTQSRRQSLTSGANIVLELSVVPLLAGVVSVSCDVIAHVTDRSLPGDVIRSITVQFSAQQPDVRFSDGSLDVVEFGTLPEQCHQYIPLTLVNHGNCAVPLKITTSSANSVYSLLTKNQLPSGFDPSLPDHCINNSVQEITVILAPYSSQNTRSTDKHRSDVSSYHQDGGLSSSLTFYALLSTPCLSTLCDVSSQTESQRLQPLQGSLNVALSPLSPTLPRSAPIHSVVAGERVLLSRPLSAMLGRVHLRVKCSEPLLMISKAVRESVNIVLPVKNSGNVDMKLVVWVRGQLKPRVQLKPVPLLVPAGCVRQLQLVYTPELESRDCHVTSQLVMQVMPAGKMFEFLIRGELNEKGADSALSVTRQHTESRAAAIASSNPSAVLSTITNTVSIHSENSAGVVTSTLDGVSSVVGGVTESVGGATTTVGVASPTPSVGKCKVGGASNAVGGANSAMGVSSASDAIHPSKQQQTAVNERRPLQELQPSATTQTVSTRDNGPIVSAGTTVSAHLQLRSSHSQLIWLAAPQGVGTRRSLRLRNCSAASLPLRLTIRNSDLFTLSLPGSTAAVGQQSLDLSISSGAEHQVEVLFSPGAVVAARAVLVIKPRHQNATAVSANCGSNPASSKLIKFSIPLLAYSGTSNVQLSGGNGVSTDETVTKIDGASVQLSDRVSTGETVTKIGGSVCVGRVRAGDSVQTAISLCNVGQRTAFITASLHWDRDRRHTVPSHQCIISPARLLLPPNTTCKLTVAIRVPNNNNNSGGAGGGRGAEQIIAYFHVVSCDEILRQAYKRCDSRPSQRLPLLRELRAHLPDEAEAVGIPAASCKGAKPAAQAVEAGLHEIRRVHERLLDSLKHVSVAVTGDVTATNADSLLVTSDDMTSLYAEETCLPALDSTLK